MDHLETVSVVSFILGGVSLILGVFLSSYLYSAVSILGSSSFYSGAGLLIFFWAISIGLWSYRNDLK